MKSGKGKKLKKNKQNEIQREMVEKIKTGLQESVKEDTRGFQMMLKMGFKKDGGLGKDEQGIKEPIGIDLDLTQKRGIGVEREKKMQNESVQVVDVPLYVSGEEYIARMKKKHMKSRSKDEEDDDDEKKTEFSSYGDDFDTFL